MNIFDLVGNSVVEINTPLRLGEVESFVFSNRLKKLLYLKTNKNYYIDYKKIKVYKNIIFADMIATFDTTNTTIIDPSCMLITLDGKRYENIYEINVDDSGNNTEIKAENQVFSYKDIYNSGENIIILQGAKRRKPIKKNINQNRTISIIKPVKKNDVKLEEITLKDSDNSSCDLLDNNLQNDTLFNTENTTKIPNENNAIINTILTNENDMENNTHFDENHTMNNTNLVDKVNSNFTSKNQINDTNSNYEICTNNVNLSANNITLIESLSKQPEKLILNKEMICGRTTTNDIYLNENNIIKKNTTITDDVINICLKLDKIVELTKNS